MLTCLHLHSFGQLHFDQTDVYGELPDLFQAGKIIWRQVHMMVLKIDMLWYFLNTIQLLMYVLYYTVFVGPSVIWQYSY